MHVALTANRTVHAMEVETAASQPTPLEASAHAPPNYFESRHQQLPPSPPQRADTPCPAALQTDRVGRGGAKNLSFVLLPDEGISNWGIGLREGSTVVGRCKSSGIRDHHVSRRHVVVTVPEEGEEGSQEGCCRIKYIGRNLRVVLVGGVLLKAEQEVAAPPGTKVILNFNNKGLPRYSYTLVPASHLPTLASSVSAGRRTAQGTASRRRGADRPQGGAKQRPGPRFRKETSETLKKERDDIFTRFANTKFL